MILRVDVVTIFPEYLAPLELSLLGKARQRGLVDVTLHDLRNVTTDVHHTVDDSPYGGGPGMVMRPEPWWTTLTPLVTPTTRVVVPSPSGVPFTQKSAADLAQQEHVVFACGRYEGIDQRVIDHFATDVFSLGDYVLAGGEVAVLVMMEAMVRLIPGVVGNRESLTDDSFGVEGATGLLEGPVYTRPETFQGYDVPAVLRSGDHRAIAQWRRHEALRRTQERRPDLLERTPLAEADRAYLDDVGR